MVLTFLALPPFAAVLFVIFVAKLAFDRLSRRKSHLPYPPGPKPKFLIGNALDFPKGNAGQVFTEWGKQFNSDILHASAFGKHVLVLNDRKLAEDLFEKRAQLYSDRPDIPIVEVIGWEYNVGLLRYGEVWRQHRKLCWQNFHSAAAKQYHPIQIERVHGFLRNVLYEPEQLFDHNTLLSISTTMLMMYGFAPTTLEDPIIHIADEGARLGASLLEPGGTFINILPFLRHVPAWLPGATAKKMAVRAHALAEEMKRIPMDRVMAAMKAGVAVPSLVTNFMEKKATMGSTPEEEAIINNVAWTTYGAASDTTISATGFFLYHMAMNPEVQRRAQEEIDHAIGNTRLPDHGDRSRLPYIEAVYREVLRRDPPLGIGIPHSSTEDDVFEGYFVPKGTMVSGNIWAMTHDETIYPDPFAFKPERFFDENGQLNDDSRILAYGFGRRVCVGKAVASDMLWLIIVSFLACFNLGKAKDEFDNEIEIDGTIIELGVVIHKKPFKCSVTPRSEQIARLIETTANQ